MESEASNNLSHSDRNSNGNDTQLANTFLINANNNNNNTGIQHTIHLASTNENIAPVYGPSSNDTNPMKPTQIQASKFMLIINWVVKQNVDDFY